MPIIRIDWDDQTLQKQEVEILSQVMRTIVSESTGIEDVFVYANSAQIKIDIAPIEIFIEMSAHKINDEGKLMATIKESVSEWKASNEFHYPINLTLIPMHWKIEIGI